jgi:hypothetical protein
MHEVRPPCASSIPTQARTDTPMQLVVGGLLGTQHGREIEIMNTFELVIDETEGKVLVDFDYFVVRKEQCESRHKPSMSIELIPRYNHS